MYKRHARENCRENGYTVTAETQCGMDKLREIVQEYPELPELSLENEGIESLDNLTPLFSGLKKLVTLILRHNNLRSLPPQLSKVFPVLETLDLRHNAIEHPDSILPGLQTMPRLKHLYVTFADEDLEDELVIGLPKLESLNGTLLVDDPTESDRTHPREFLDDYDQTDDAELSPPHHSQKPSQQPQQSAAAKLPASQPTANGSSTSARVAVAGKGGSGLSETDLDSVASLFEAVKSLRNDRSMEEERMLAARFDAHIRKSLQRHEDAQRSAHDEASKVAGVVYAKKQLYSICISELIEFFNLQLPEYVGPLKAFRQVYEELVDEGIGALQQCGDSQEREVAALQEDLERAEKETTDLLEAAELLELEAQTNQQERQQMVAQHSAERTQLVEEIGWLKAENERLMNRLRQVEFNSSRMEDGPPAPQAVSGGKPESSGKKSGAASGVSTPGFSESGTGLVGYTEKYLLQSGKVTATATTTDAATSGTGKAARLLTLRQLKDIVDEIYTSKVRYDQKCADSQLPRETMEQHLYTFLNQKYGLRSLILDWAAAIIFSVKRYAPVDNDICVFGKILRNEIDEEFRYVQKQLKETVFQLLKVYLKGKYPLKPDSEIQEMLKKRSQGFIHEEEWVDIVKYMYNEEDSVQLIIQIREVIELTHQERQQRRGAAPKAAPTKAHVRPRIRRTADRDAHDNKLLYSDFVKVLLDYQLAGHERFLSQFVQHFRAHDGNSDGVLDEMEFRALLLQMDPNKSERELQNLLQLIDPFSHQHITFSECVTFLSSELVRMMSKPSAPNPPPGKQ